MDIETAQVLRGAASGWIGAAVLSVFAVPLFLGSRVSSPRAPHADGV